MQNKILKIGFNKGILVNIVKYILTIGYIIISFSANFIFVNDIGLLNQQVKQNNFTSELVYKRGFLYSCLDSKIIPPHYHQINSNLWVDQDVEVAISSDQSVIIFGLVVDIRDERSSLKTIANNLAQALSISEIFFHKEGDFLCGRYSIIYNCDGVTKIVTDATGMRAIYHSKNANVVAGHAKLVADNLANREVESKRNEFGYSGSLGRLTPYEGVFILIPNTALNLYSGNIKRFYPYGPLTTLSIKDGAQQMSSFVTTALKGLELKNDNLILSITAGVDSRCTLAYIRRLYQQVPQCFTYCNHLIAHNRRDAAFAKDLSLRFNFPHKVILVDPMAIDENLLKIVQKNSYYLFHPEIMQELINVYNTDNLVHIGSNLCEIGRAFFAKLSKETIRNVFSQDVLCRLFFYNNGSRNKWTKKQLNFIETALEEYTSFTNLNHKTLFNYDIRDIYYWEQRMATWYSQVCIAYDIVCETFIPYNARAILTIMLQLPFEDRISNALLKNIISDYWPEVEKLPINPKYWQ